MAKRLRLVRRLPFYVFKQDFVCSDSFEEIQENICDFAETAKEPSWYEFWLTQGNEITLDEWKIKYKDYIDETVVETVDENEEQIDESRKEAIESEIEAVEDVQPPAGLENKTNPALTWQELWDEHTIEVYKNQYMLFEEIYGNYYWNLKEALQEENKTKKIKSEYIFENGSDLELLRLAGLPTAFGKSKQAKTNKQNKQIEQIEYLETSDLTSESEYSSESDSEKEMPPVKGTNPNSANQNDFENGKTDDENLHKINNKTISKAKPKKNRKLRNMPDFILEDTSMHKYWRQRFSLFSRFDEGIRLDRESWFSVTPEKVAEHMAKRMACNVIIDGFCGSGGNAIQFAKTCKQVIAIDIDPSKIEMARHNAGIYGVADKIEFIVGDFLELSKTGCLQGDVVFLSPPWGGPTYTKLSDYDIEQNLQPIGASPLMDLARLITNNIAFFLPRNSKIKQIIRLAGVGNSCEVEHNYLGSRVVGLTAFYGEHFSTKVNT